MKYALNLASDGRILSVTFAKYAVKNSVVVDALPGGDASEYLYVNGEYIHSPLPEPEQPEEKATTDEVLNTLLGVNE